MAGTRCEACLRLFQVLRWKSRVPRDPSPPRSPKRGLNLSHPCPDLGPPGEKPRGGPAGSAAVQLRAHGQGPSELAGRCLHPSVGTRGPSHRKLLQDPCSTPRPELDWPTWTKSSTLLGTTRGCP